jgi:hypothetical protein
MFEGVRVELGIPGDDGCEVMGHYFGMILRPLGPKLKYIVYPLFSKEQSPDWVSAEIMRPGTSTSIKESHRTIL